MKKLLSAASVLALCASPALVFAQDSENNLDQAGEAAQQSVESAGEALSETGEAIEEGAEDAAEATGEAAREAGETIEEGAQSAAEGTAEAARETGEAVEETVEGAAETTAEGVEGAAEETADTAEGVEQEFEEDAAEGEAGPDDGMQAVDTDMRTESDDGTDTAQGMGDDDDATMETGESDVPEVAATNDPIDESNAFRGALLMGNNIWAVRERVEGDDWEVDLETGNLADNYENVGSIDDILINADGELVGVLAEVGGFLGIGDKLVMVGLDELRVTLQDGQPHFVTRIAADDLEEREAVAEDMWAN